MRIWWTSDRRAKGSTARVMTGTPARSSTSLLRVPPKRAELPAAGRMTANRGIACVCVYSVDQVDEGDCGFGRRAGDDGDGGDGGKGTDGDASADDAATGAAGVIGDGAAAAPSTLRPK